MEAAEPQHPLPIEAAQHMLVSTDTYLLSDLVSTRGLQDGVMLLMRSQQAVSNLFK